MAEKAQVLLVIHGRVQGVFFRFETQKMAKKLGLTGWVKNNDLGTVECLAEGDKINLEKLAEWCKSGPDSALVEKVEIKWLPYVGGFEGFEIK